MTEPPPDTSSPTESPTDRLGALGTLAEPNRRALYEHVAAAGDWVSRDQAADAVGLERGTAAHHLDRLAGEGLLDVEYRRLSGRRGPGAGRPAKLYRRARRDLEVSLPPRDYELAGRLLAEAADRSRGDGVDFTAALDGVARSHGERLAGEMRTRLASDGGRQGPSPSSPSPERRRAVVDVLAAHGYEPRTTDDGTIVLGNCPFHRLAKQHRELVCGMNLCLLDSAVAHVEATDLTARLEPADGLCCVRLHTTP